MVKNIDLGNITHILLIIFTCLIFTLICTFYIKKIAFHIKALDIPNERKVHTKPMPRLGGLGIFLGFLFVIIRMCISLFLMPTIVLGTLSKTDAD